MAKTYEHITETQVNQIVEEWNRTHEDYQYTPNAQAVLDIINAKATLGNKTTDRLFEDVDQMSYGLANRLMEAARDNRASRNLSLIHI